MSNCNRGTALEPLCVCLVPILNDFFLTMPNNDFSYYLIFSNSYLTLSVPNFRRHFVVCFYFLTNYRLKRNLYVKLKDWMSNSVDPDETAHMSRLIWIYVVCKSLLLSPVAVKELSMVLKSLLL